MVSAIVLARSPPSSSSRALVIHPGNSQALVRRAQAYGELGRFRLAVEDLEAAEASVLTEMCRRRPQKQGVGEVLPGELGEVRKRLEHARWTKVGLRNCAHMILFLRIGVFSGCVFLCRLD